MMNSLCQNQVIVLNAILTDALPQAPDANRVRLFGLVVLERALDVVFEALHDLGLDDAVNGVLVVLQVALSAKYALHKVPELVIQIASTHHSTFNNVSQIKS